MLTAGQGQTITIEADFYQYAGGPAIDLDGITLTIVDPNDVTEVNATASTGIVNPVTGIYDFTWPIPLTAPTGIHAATWTGTHQSNAVTAAETILVTTENGDTWCSIGDVLTFTGETVDATTIAQAGATIDIHAGRAYAIDGSRVGSRDLYWLKLACAYQAAWLPSQVDMFSRVDALGIQAGRRMIELRDTALVLAPNARKALKRVSWLKSRSVHVKSPFQDGLGVAGLNPLSSATDSLGPWSPIEGW